MPYRSPLNIRKPSISNELALLLGLFAGDGCLSISHNGDGNRIYPVRFYNTNKSYVELFAHLFFQVFSVKGNIRVKKRNGKKPLYEFEKYSKQIYILLNIDFEISNGKKALTVSIPSFILNGSIDLQKHFFLGLLVTDGSLRKKDDILFHMASEQLLLDLQQLILAVWGFKRNILLYTQREKFVSYQLTLNKRQSSLVLQTLPSSHNLVLR